jgi:hypothetical protein
MDWIVFAKLTLAFLIGLLARSALSSIFNPPNAKKKNRDFAGRPDQNKKENSSDNGKEGKEGYFQALNRIGYFLASNDEKNWIACSITPLQDSDPQDHA